MIHNIDECLIIPNNVCVPLQLTRCNGVLELDIFLLKRKSEVNYWQTIETLFYKDNYNYSCCKVKQTSKKCKD